MSSSSTVRDLPLFSSQDIVDFFSALPQDVRLHVINKLPDIIESTTKDMDANIPEIRKSRDILVVIKLCAETAEEEFKELG